MQVWGIFSSLHCTPGKYSSPSTPHTSAVLPVVEQREQSPPSSPVSEMTQIRSSKCHTVSLVPRPPPNLVSRLHPLMRRNSLVNQVEFPGPAHAFCYSPAIFKTFCGKLTQKFGYSNGDDTVVREVLHDNYWSCNLVGFLLLLNNKPKKFDFILRTVSTQETHAGWTWD